MAPLMQNQSLNRSLSKSSSMPNMHIYSTKPSLAKESPVKLERLDHFYSRKDQAKEPAIHKQRLNKDGYDRDNPKSAIETYEKHHPLSLKTRALNFITNSVFNVATLGIPQLLSLSAGKKKQRIDQKLVLNIVRESVDKFPELKIRLSSGQEQKMDPEKRIQWHENMAIIRQAQHDFIIDKLNEAYPGHINLDAPTILYTGGRATGCLRVLYCSVDEYVALYWSDWGLSSTDSGSYKAHVYDYIMEGQNINWKANHFSENSSDFEIAIPGEYTFLGRGERKIWSFDGPCAMVDHGIGDVISMAKFATLSNATNTLNFEAIGSLLSSQVGALAHEYGLRLKNTLGFSEISAQMPKSQSEEKIKEAQNYFAEILA